LELLELGTTEYDGKPGTGGHYDGSPADGLFLVALVSFISAAPVPTHLMPRDPPLTFPTAVGTKWVYELPGGREQTIVISEMKEEKDGAKVVTMEYVENGKRAPYQVRRISNQGIFVLVDGGQKFEEPLCIVSSLIATGRRGKRTIGTWATWTNQEVGEWQGPLNRSGSRPENFRRHASRGSSMTVRRERTGT
jgi:hypothetical protein